MPYMPTFVAPARFTDAAAKAQAAVVRAIVALFLLLAPAPATAVRLRIR